MDRLYRCLVLGCALTCFGDYSAAQTATCATAEGNWLDTENFRWSLAQNSNGVINGTVQVHHLGKACPVSTWPVAGQSDGGGWFTARATNPTGGDETCVSAFTYNGYIQKPGCHTGGGLWTNDAGYIGAWEWSKPCEVPTGESNAPIAWDSSDPTVFIWEASLAPSSKNFDGRTVGESVNTGDGCWFPGSIFAEVTGTDGNDATVNANGYRDNVGYVSAAVTYYRAQMRAPCSFSSVQRMRIDCATENRYFVTNALSGTIGVSTVSSSRAGQTQTRTWP